MSALVSLLVSKSVLTKIRFRDILNKRAGLWAGPFLLPLAEPVNFLAINRLHYRRFNGGYVADKQHQTIWQRTAAISALFAILLIVVAPLISVALQKDPMSVMPGMHHDMSSMSMTGHHDHEMMPTSVPVDHAEACGYCVLLAHVPGLMLALVVLLSLVQQRICVRVHRPVLRHWRFFPWLWPDTRAPPHPSAFFH